jgi:glycosyltransferase involved in cell wall biosynthesis
MKILIAADLFPPVINGVSTFSRNLAAGMAARGHEVVVIAPSQTGKKHTEQVDGYTIERTASLVFPLYQKLRVSTTPGREVNKIITHFAPDVIHIQMIFAIGHSVLQAGQKKKIPIVSTNHAVPDNVIENIRLLAPLSRPISSMLEHYAKRFHSNAQYITAPTKSAITMFKDKYAKIRVPVKVVSNGIDLSVFHPGEVSKNILHKYDIPSDRPVLLYVGRLDGEKHLPVFLSAVHRILAHRPVHAVLVGHGVEEAALQVLASKLGIEKKVTFTGRVSFEDLVQLYRVGTIFCMPSPAELQSIATLEAMASGLPVVSVNEGALPELCQDGKNGYLFRYDNDEMMAVAIEKILKTPGLQQRMGQVSIEIAKKHDIHQTLEAFETIYESLLPKEKKDSSR